MLESNNISIVRKVWNETYNIIPKTFPKEWEFEGLGQNLSKWSSIIRKAIWGIKLCSFDSSIWYNIEKVYIQGL